MGHGEHGLRRMGLCAGFLACVASARASGERMSPFCADLFDQLTRAAVHMKSGEKGRAMVRSVALSLPLEDRRYIENLDPSDTVDRYTLELLKKWNTVDGEELFDRKMEAAHARRSASTVSDESDYPSEVPRSVSRAAGQILNEVPSPLVTDADIERLSREAADRNRWNGIHPEIKPLLENYQYGWDEVIRRFDGVDPHTPEGFEKIRQIDLEARRGTLTRNPGAKYTLERMLRQFSKESPTEEDIEHLKQMVALRVGDEHLHPDVKSMLTFTPLEQQKLFWDLDPDTKEGWRQLENLKKHEDEEVREIAGMLLSHKISPERAQEMFGIEALEQLGLRQRALRAMNPRVRARLSARRDLSASDLDLFAGIDPDSSVGQHRLRELIKEIDRKIADGTFERPDRGLMKIEAEAEMDRFMKSLDADYGRRMERLKLARAEAEFFLRNSRLSPRPAKGDVERLAARVAESGLRRRREQAWTRARSKLDATLVSTFHNIDPNNPQHLDRLRRMSTDYRLSRTLRQAAKQLLSDFSDGIAGVDASTLEELRRSARLQVQQVEAREEVFASIPRVMRPYLEELNLSDLKLFRDIDARKKSDRVRLMDYATSPEFDPWIQEAAQRILMFVPRTVR